ncbi:hypothetical protein PFISCL1PPCAC_12097, partial [Pristionchus fissidentatus]
MCGLSRSINLPIRLRLTAHYFTPIAELAQKSHDVFPSRQTAPSLLERRLHQSRGKKIVDERSSIRPFSPFNFHSSYLSASPPFNPV